MRLSRHRNINITLICTQLVSFKSDEFSLVTATTVEEAEKFAQAGFRYFDSLQRVQIYRERKRKAWIKEAITL